MAMTFTYDETGPIWKIIAVWTCDASGDAAATTKKITGSLIKGVTDPGAAAPTADYDIVLTDPEGINLLGLSADDLVDRHTTTTEEVYFYLSTGLRDPVVADKITVTVSNAGNAKNGEIILYYRPG